MPHCLPVLPTSLCRCSESLGAAHGAPYCWRAGVRTAASTPSRWCSLTSGHSATSSPLCRSARWVCQRCGTACCSEWPRVAIQYPVFNPEVGGQLFLADVGQSRLSPHHTLLRQVEYKEACMAVKAAQHVAPSTGGCPLRHLPTPSAQLYVRPSAKPSHASYSPASCTRACW